MAFVCGCVLLHGYLFPSAVTAVHVPAAAAVAAVAELTPAFVAAVLQPAVAARQLPALAVVITGTVNVATQPAPAADLITAPPAKQFNALEEKAVVQAAAHGWSLQELSRLSDALAAQEEETHSNLAAIAELRVDLERSQRHARSLNLQWRTAEESLTRITRERDALVKNRPHPTLACCCVVSRSIRRIHCSPISLRAV